MKTDQDFIKILNEMERPSYTTPHLSVGRRLREHNEYILKISRERVKEQKLKYNKSKQEYLEFLKSIK